MAHQFGGCRCSRVPKGLLALRVSNPRMPKGVERRWSAARATTVRMQPHDEFPPYDLDRQPGDSMATPIHEAIVESWNPALTVRLAPLITLTDDQFFEFCQLNRDLRIERTAEGALVLMAPAGAQSGARNAELTYQLLQSVHRDRSGIAF